MPKKRLPPTRSSFSPNRFRRTTSSAKFLRECLSDLAFNMFIISFYLFCHFVAMKATEIQVFGSVLLLLDLFLELVNALDLEIMKVAVDISEAIHGIRDSDALVSLCFVQIAL